MNYKSSLYCNICHLKCTEARRILRVSFKCVNAVDSFWGPCGDLSLRARVSLNILEMVQEETVLKNRPFKTALPSRHVIITRHSHWQDHLLLHLEAENTGKHRKALCYKYLSSSFSTCWAKAVMVCFVLRPSTTPTEGLGLRRGRSVPCYAPGADAPIRSLCCCSTHPHSLASGEPWEVSFPQDEGCEVGIQEPSPHLQMGHFCVRFRLQNPQRLGRRPHPCWAPTLPNPVFPLGVCQRVLCPRACF